MIKRKRYIIDKSFQLRTTFTIIGLVSIITAVILGVITISVVYNNNSLRENNTKITNIYEIENSIFVSLTSLPEAVKDANLKEALLQNSRNHDRNMETLNRIITDNTGIIRYNRILLASILIIVVIESIALYVILIRKTHHISGPIYVMSNFMKDIIDGKDPKLRPLREKDELKEFYNLFQDMVKAVRKDDRENP